MYIGKFVSLGKTLPSWTKFCECLVPKSEVKLLRDNACQNGDPQFDEVFKNLFW